MIHRPAMPTVGIEPMIAVHVPATGHTRHQVTLTHLANTTDADINISICTVIYL